MHERRRTNPSSTSVRAHYHRRAHMFSRQSDRRLAQQTKLLKERNASLLRAVSAVKASGGGSAAQGGAEE